MFLLLCYHNKTYFLTIHLLKLKGKIFAFKNVRGLVYLEPENCLAQYCMKVDNIKFRGLIRKKDCF